MTLAGQGGDPAQSGTPSEVSKGDELTCVHMGALVSIGKGLGGDWWSSTTVRASHGKRCQKPSESISTGGNAVARCGRASKGPTDESM